jgi:hypothetical protein
MKPDWNPVRRRNNLCVSLACNLTTTCAILPLLVSVDDKMEASVTECYFSVVRTDTQRFCKSAAAALLHVGLYKMQDKALLIVDRYFTNSSTTLPNILRPDRPEYGILGASV